MERKPSAAVLRTLSQRDQHFRSWSPSWDYLAVDYKHVFNTTTHTVIHTSAMTSPVTHAIEQGVPKDCAVELAAGHSPNPIHDGQPLLLRALALGAKGNGRDMAPFLYMLAAAGATLALTTQTEVERYYRLLAMTRDVPLMKTLTKLWGLPEPAIKNGLCFQTVWSAACGPAAVHEIVGRFAELRTLTPATREWWNCIHPGQRARLLAAARCMSRSKIPPELVRLIVYFSPVDTVFIQ